MGEAKSRWGMLTLDEGTRHPNNLSTGCKDGLSMVTSRKQAERIFIISGSFYF